MKIEKVALTLKPNYKYIPVTITHNYEEWNEDIKEEGGWVVMLNTPAHTESEMKQAHLQQFGHFMEIDNWRTFQPGDFFQLIDNKLLRIG